MVMLPMTDTQNVGQVVQDAHARLLRFCALP
jgi:hypothetical protein